MRFNLLNVNETVLHISHVCANNNNSTHIKTHKQRIDIGR